MVPAFSRGVLRGHGAPVEHLSVLGDGPHLVGAADGDGLEGLVRAHVQPGAALWDQTQRSEERRRFFLKRTDERLVFQQNLTAAFWGVTPSRHKTSPLSLRAQTGTCSMLLWARQGIREMSLRRMGGTRCHGPVNVIVHFLRAERSITPAAKEPRVGNRRGMRASHHLVHRLRLTKSFMALWP